MDEKKYKAKLHSVNKTETRGRWLWMFLLLLASIVSAANAKK